MLYSYKISYFLKDLNLKTKIIDGSTYVFDLTRKKYLLLTPEERVRQLFIHYLINQLGYSKNHIRTEIGVKYHSLQKRSDILVFDRENQPYLLVECKAESVAVNQETVEQASRYNQVFKAPYLCVTNGIKTYCFQIDFENNRFLQLNEVPLPKV